MLTKRQEAELVTAIQGRGEIPLKFVYLGDGALNWDKIARQRSEEDGINSVEGALLEKRITDFISTLEPNLKVNVIDIGCGNGMPMFPVLDFLEKNSREFRYVPLDISQEMLDLARETIIAKYGNIEIQEFKLDFELGQFSDVIYDLKKQDSVNLMLFLGSTLGNHSDLHRVLTNFRDSMSSKDFLIVGVELTNLAKAQNILRHYEGEDIINFVSFILDHLTVPRSNYEYETIWNEQKNQVELSAVFKKNTPVEVAGEKFVLGKGEKLLLARSRKFTEAITTELLSDVGFRTELLTTNPERGYLLSMVQPTRYSV